MTTNIADMYLSNGDELRNSIKTLRTNIHFAGIDKPIQTILITSSIPDEGKSSITSFLGIEMAQAGKKTIIVDCDFRRPLHSGLFKVKVKKGLYGYLTNEYSLDEAIAPTKIDSLHLLLPENSIINPVETIGAERFSNLINELKKHNDMIIFDSPPLNTFIDAALIASQVDGTALIIRSGKAKLLEVQSAVDQLKKANAHIIGVVLNAVPRNESSSYHYYNYYYKHRD